MAAVLPGPAGAQVAPPAWLGATFERPAAELRTVLGDPVLVTRLPDASPSPPPGARSERKARYILSLREPLFLIVSERHGVVVGIEAFSNRPLSAESQTVAPDPSGVRLGATEAVVRAAHPEARPVTDSFGDTQLAVPVSPRYIAAYRMQTGRVTAITWFARPESDPAADGPPLSEPAGDSPATAVLDVQKTEDDGILWEFVWEAYHRCDGRNPWQKKSVATSHENGRVYDAVTLQCPSSGATRTVYFDITSFFGKFEKHEGAAT